MSSFIISGPYDIRNAHKAPDSIGLYVWYGRFSIGRADWHSDFVPGGEDAAQIALHQVLQEHSLKFSNLDLSIEAIANFSTKWEGTLEEAIGSRWQDNFNIDSSEGTEKSALKNVVSQNRTREALVNIITTSFPIFNSPLYLGLAVEQTLRERLKQHKRAFLSLWGLYEKDREIIDRITKPKDFAERAFKKGFIPEDLFCYTLALEQSPNDGLTKDELKDLIVLSEWILNRWATPILGRK